MEVLMQRGMYTLLLLGAAIGVMHCKSYEDSFNRNLDSTGLYITNSASNTISQFGADPKSGILNDLGTVAAGTTPFHVALNAAGTFAYVVNSGSNDVYVYSVNKTTRKLTLASTATTGTTPRMIAFHKSGQYAYVINEGSTDISKFFVDSTTGALTSLGATTAAGGTPNGMVTFVDNIVISVSNAAQLRLFDITASTGAIAANGTPANAVSAVPRGISILALTSSTAMLYAPTLASQLEYIATLNWGGAAAAVAADAVPVYMGISPSGKQAIVSNYTAGNVTLYSLSNGVPTLAATVTACTNPAQNLINSSGYAYVVCSGENKIHAYAVGTSGLTLIGSYATGTTPAGVAGY